MPKASTPATLYCRIITECYPEVFASNGVQFGRFNNDIRIPARTNDKHKNTGTQLRIDLNGAGIELVPKILEGMQLCCPGFVFDGNVLDSDEAKKQKISAKCTAAYIAPQLPGYKLPLTVVFMGNNKQYKGSKRVRKDGTVVEATQTEDNFTILNRFTPSALGFTEDLHPEGVSYNEMHYGFLFSNINPSEEDIVGNGIAAVGPMLVRSIDVDGPVRGRIREFADTFPIWKFSNGNRGNILKESAEGLSGMHLLKQIHKETGKWMTAKFYKTMTYPIFDYEVRSNGKTVYMVSVKSGTSGGANPALSGIEPYAWKLLKKYSNRSIPECLCSFVDFAFPGMLKDFLDGRNEWTTRPTARKVEQTIYAMFLFAKKHYNCPSGKAFLQIWNAFDGRMMDPDAWTNATMEIALQFRKALETVEVELGYTDEEFLAEIQSGRYGLATYYIGNQMAKDINANTNIHKGLNAVLQSIDNGIQSYVNIHAGKEEMKTEVVVRHLKFSESKFEFAFQGYTDDSFEINGSKFGFHWHMVDK